MISPTSAGGGFDNRVFAGPGGNLGKQEFLQLLVAQLRHQDPLNPLQADQFAAQLAQFSSVEQLISINDALRAQADMADIVLQTTNAAAAVSVLGRDVVATGDTLVVANGDLPRATIDLSAAADVTIRVFDSAGNEVFTTTQFLRAGRNQVDLDPAAVGDGTYRFTVEAVATDGSPVVSRTLTTGRVDALRYTSNGPMLIIGGVEFPLAAILEIKP